MRVTDFEVDNDEDDENLKIPQIQRPKSTISKVEVPPVPKPEIVKPEEIKNVEDPVVVVVPDLA